MKSPFFTFLSNKAFAISAEVWSAYPVTVYLITITTTSVPRRRPCELDDNIESIVTLLLSTSYIAIITLNMTASAAIAASSVICIISKLPMIEKTFELTVLEFPWISSLSKIPSPSASVSRKSGVPSPSVSMLPSSLSEIPSLSASEFEFLEFANVSSLSNMPSPSLSKSL